MVPVSWFVWTILQIFFYYFFAVEQGPRASISLWYYRSEGLSAHGQKEVVLMLEKLPKEAVFPQQIMVVYKAIYHLAKSGRIRVLNYI